jgi:hypothetical protein
VSGTYRDPSGNLACTVEQDGANVRISQAVRRVHTFGPFAETPTFDLALGASRPYSLTIEAGASDVICDFARLPLTRLLIQQGIGNAVYDFSAPCAASMSLLQVEAGVVDMRIHHLANANAAEITVDGGAAAYHFDFDGSLQRDAHARINTGMSSVQIAIPATTAARIALQSFLGSLQVGDGFTKRDDAFCTPAALGGNPPVLTAQAQRAKGDVRLRLM